MSTSILHIPSPGLTLNSLPPVRHSTFPIPVCRKFMYGTRHVKVLIISLRAPLQN
jgi:hypothetical protein